MSYSIKELVAWNESIEKLARNMGLDYYPQEFEIINFEDMITLELWQSI